MGVRGKRLCCAGEEGAGSVGRGESVEEEVCVVVPDRGGLGKFLDKGLEECICFLGCC